MVWLIYEKLGAKETIISLIDKNDDLMDMISETNKKRKKLLKMKNKFLGYFWVCHWCFRCYLFFYLLQQMYWSSVICMCFEFVLCIDICNDNEGAYVIYEFNI